MIAGEREVRAAFDAELESLHMRGQWRIDELLNAERRDGPLPMGAPHIWKWSTVRQALSGACEALSNSLTQRRSLQLVNPGLSNLGTTQNLGVGVQLVMPGECAWAHRHTMAAIRFGIEGNTAVSTIVDGERLPMEPGDLILTPSLSWHDHHNQSDQDAIWLDVIDAPLAGALGQRWYEPFGERLQPEREHRSDYVSERAKDVRPTWEHRRALNIPYRYPWREVRELLEQHAESKGSPYDGVRLEYVNPVTGGPTLATMGCFVQLLRPGLETQEHRHTSSSANFVIEGEGTTIVDGVELSWSERDVFVIPNWTRHRHVNMSSQSNAILFSVTDEPLLSAIGLYREDPDPSSYMRPSPLIPANAGRTR